MIHFCYDQKGKLTINRENEKQNSEKNVLQRWCDSD